ncbi:uncharacterized protein LOC134268863 [Saccostrea cucullata]|uniref:uncharacterized protein LOC134268863 n=1 Tax=Saccostrea cuccullata TaxID=36930 RepID=UPI002ED50045
MATSSSWAQDVITCDLCDNPTQQFCNSYRRERLVFSSCASHPNQKCEGHCQQCDVPVCFRCLTGPHRPHTIIDMSEVVQQMKEEIKKETEEIESFISRFALSGANIDLKISKMTEKFETMEREGENLRKSWHEEVDNIFDTLQSTIRKMKDGRLTALRSHHYKSELTDFRDIPTDVDVKIPSLNSNTVQGRELSIELGEYKATLTQTSISSLTDEVSILSVRKLLDKAKVIATIPSRIKSLRHIICTRNNEAWACSGDRFIRRIDIRGSIKEKIATKCKPSPNEISVTRKGELIYSDHDSRTVNIVRQGKIETLITLPRGWHPDGLCCTRSGDILVSGQPGVLVDENNNGDICASDFDTSTVIVMDKTGRVRFRYDDENGQFLRCISNCGLRNLGGLSVDSEGRLWVGCFDSGDIKVIQYME